MSWWWNPPSPSDRPTELSRIFLDPATAKASQWPVRSVRLVPQAVREFGYAPDEELLLPGDVILVTAGNWVARLIARAQLRGGFMQDHAMWTHVGLYIGRGQIVEAAPFGGVRINSLVAATFGRKILIRRRLGEGVDIQTRRYQIAIEGLTGLRRGYSLATVPRLAWQAFNQRLWTSDHRPGIASVTICSTLVRNAYTLATRLDPVPQVTGVVWPADLSQTDELADQDIGWIRLKRNLAA